MNKEYYHLYVDAKSSKDNCNGTKENPFTSIQQAKEYVRTLDKTKGDIIIEIADGTYELSETLFFSETDSGTDNCNIRYIAAEGAKPVISGCRKVSGSWHDEGNGIYSIEYNREKKLRSLYIDGTRCYMTSKVIKGKGACGKYEIEADSADWAWISGTAKDGVLLPGNSIPSDTRNADDIELMTQTTWNTTIVCVDKLEKHVTGICAKLQMPYAAIAQTLGWGNEYQFKKNNMAYNVFEWLDEPGEFYFDKTGNRLYYYPRENENINEADVVVPELETLVRIEGIDLQHRVHNISFEGLTFANTDWNLYEVDGSHGRATNQGAAGVIAYAEENWHDYIYRSYDVGPAAVYVSSASNIDFEGNTICHTGNDGLSLVNDTENIIINGNVIYDIAGSALLIGHPQHMYIGDKGGNYGTHTDKEKYDAAVEGVCRNTDVTNNLFKDTGRMFWGASGVMVYVAQELNLTNNQVENTPYSGISLGWGWWNMNGDTESVIPDCPSTTMKNNSITNNRFINTITTLSDAGAIYTIGDMPGTVISENYIKTIGAGKSNTYHIRGIHIDEGTQHVYGERNVIDIDSSFTCIDCGDWGKKGNNTWDNNYSTSSSYTTTETYEPGTVFTNAHTVESGKWDDTALAIINSAGIKEEYFYNIPEGILNETPAIIKAIPTYKVNVPLIVGTSVGGAVILAGTVVAVIIRIRKKRKNNSGNI